MSGNFDMTALETVTNQYLGGDASLACSEKTSAEIDREVVSIIRAAHEKAVNILKENNDKMCIRDRGCAGASGRSTATACTTRWVSRPWGSGRTPW